MAKVDFAKIIVKDIEDHDLIFNIQKQLGNQLYMQGQNIEECELGRKIYHAKGEVELDDKEADIIRKAIGGYSYIARTAIEEKLKK